VADKVADLAEVAVKVVVVADFVFDHVFEHEGKLAGEGLGFHTAGVEGFEAEAVHGPHLSPGVDGHACITDFAVDLVGDAAVEGVEADGTTQRGQKVEEGCGLAASGFGVDDEVVVGSRRRVDDGFLLIGVVGF
jgi:hypothetical protein